MPFLPCIYDFLGTTGEAEGLGCAFQNLSGLNPAYLKIKWHGLKTGIKNFIHVAQWEI